MKKILLIFFVLILGSVVLAQENGVGVSIPFLLPDNPFYFVNNIFESIQKTFAFSPQAKSSLAIELANKRLIEARELSNKGNFSLALIQVGKADEELSNAVLFSEGVLVIEEKQELNIKISNVSIFAVSIIEEVKQSAPVQARFGLEIAIENISKTAEISQEDVLVSLVDVAESKFSIFIGQGENFCNSINGVWTFTIDKIGCENIAGVQCDFGSLGMVSDACEEAGAVYSCSGSGVTCERLS